MSQDRDILDALETQHKQRPGSNSDLLNMDMASVVGDCTEAEQVGAGELWPEGYHFFEIISMEPKRSKVREDGTGGNAPYLLLNLMCLAGPMKTKVIEDRIMLEGKGKARFVNLAAACDLYDREKKLPIGTFNDLIGKQVWGNLITETSTFKGRERKRSVFDFGAYEHASAYENPDGDPFNEGVQQKAAAKAEAPKPAAAPVAQPAPAQVEETEAGAETDTAPFVDEAAAAPRARRAAAASQPTTEAPW
jgi:hypothetical protein